MEYEGPGGTLNDYVLGGHEQIHIKLIIRGIFNGIDHIHK